MCSNDKPLRKRDDDDDDAPYTLQKNAKTTTANTKKPSLIPWTVHDILLIQYIIVCFPLPHLNKRYKCPVYIDFVVVAIIVAIVIAVAEFLQPETCKKLINSIMKLTRCKAYNKSNKMSVAFWRHIHSQSHTT